MSIGYTTSYRYVLARGARPLKLKCKACFKSVTEHVSQAARLECFNNCIELFSLILVDVGKTLGANAVDFENLFEYIQADSNFTKSTFSEFYGEDAMEETKVTDATLTMIQHFWNDVEFGNMNWTCRYGLAAQYKKAHSIAV